eukprot:1979552-Amphidinium_carterae.3
MGYKLYFMNWNGLKVALNPLHLLECLLPNCTSPSLRMRGNTINNTRSRRAGFSHLSAANNTGFGGLESEKVSRHHFVQPSASCECGPLHELRMWFLQDTEVYAVFLGHLDMMTQLYEFTAIVIGRAARQSEKMQQEQFAGATISTSNKTKQTVAHSSAEAELYAIVSLSLLTPEFFHHMHDAS